VGGVADGVFRMALRGIPHHRCHRCAGAADGWRTVWSLVLIASGAVRTITETTNHDNKKQKKKKSKESHSLTFSFSPRPPAALPRGDEGERERGETIAIPRLEERAQGLRCGVIVRRGSLVGGFIEARREGLALGGSIIRSTARLAMRMRGEGVALGGSSRHSITCRARQTSRRPVGLCVSPVLHDACCCWHSFYRPLVLQPPARGSGGEAGMGVGSLSSRYKDHRGRGRCGGGGPAGYLFGDKYLFSILPNQQRAQSDFCLILYMVNYGRVGKYNMRKSKRYGESAR
jgi:hypothetical protein